MAENSVFVVQNFSKEFQNLKKMGELKLGEDGLIKIESEEKNQKKTRENYHEKKNFNISGFRRLHSMKPEEVWQEIEEKGGMKEDKNGEGDE